MKYEIKYIENKIECIKIIEGKTLEICVKKYVAFLKKINKTGREVKGRKLK